MCRIARQFRRGIMVAPLSGIKVLEVASWLAAPSSAALMADLGADVVKVEPPGGDTYRHSAFYPKGSSVATTHPFELDNRGKRSVTVDLGSPGAADALRPLIESADIFVTNLIQRRREAYHLTPDIVRSINPRIIYVSFSGFGSDGPDKNKQGFDHTAFWASSGLMSLVGGPEAPPPTCRGGQGDHTTSLNLLASTLAALRLRDQTGEGQLVEVTLMGTGMWTLGLDLMLALAGEKPQRADRTRPRNPLANTYRCRDGRWLLLYLSQADRYWAPFCKMTGREDLLEDDCFGSMASRREHSADLVREIDAIIGAEDFETWRARFDAADFIWAPVKEIADVIADPTVATIGAFTEVPDSYIGPYRTLSTPFRIQGADIAVRGPAPAPGEHTMEVLKEHGVSDEAIATLAAQGVFG